MRTNLSGFLSGGLSPVRGREAPCTPVRYEYHAINVDQEVRRRWSIRRRNGEQEVEMPEEKPRQSTESVALRNLVADDLPRLFEIVSDPEANRMAAFIPRDWETFIAHWTTILANPNVDTKAILADGRFVGQIACFQRDEEHCIGYWIAKEDWGRGYASRALELMLQETSVRPLHAYAAKSNVASIRVLEKCGFKIVGYEHSPATERYLECEEAILMLT